jgi:hypothetical protein
MNRTKLFVFLGLAALGLMLANQSAFAADPAPAPTPPAVATDATQNAVSDEMAALLNKRLPEVKFDNVALADVIDFLRDVTGANVHVDWRSFEAAGIDKNAQVSLRLRNVKFSTVLDTVLSEFTTPERKVSYKLLDNIILIAVHEELPATAGQPQARVQDSQSRVVVVNNLRDLCVDPDAMTVVAIGSLRSEVGLNGDDVIRILEDELKRADDSALPYSARNAMRLTLKDLYLSRGQTADASRVLVDMVRDNGKVQRSYADMQRRLEPFALPTTRP